MWVANTVSEIRRQRQPLDGTVALVPTMGSLHDGHISLITRARQSAGHVIVSIFVNPTQFNQPQDFVNYPRTTEQDLQACRDARVCGVFMPDQAQVYPDSQWACEVSVPALTNDLEARHRPRHFDGVCRVVVKLLNMVQPDVACFGSKDYQQLKVIQAMVADLAMPVRIDSAPTVRETDGLALSSRNARLEAQNRDRAVALYKSLCEAKRLIEQAGESDPQVVEAAMRQIMIAYHIDIDYAQIRHPATLAPLDSIDPPLTHGVVALVAGTVGPVRLIDNMLLGEPQPVQKDTECPAD